MIVDSSVGSRLVALAGARLWTRDSEGSPPPGAPCWLCGAIRYVQDERSPALIVEVHDPVTDEDVELQTGIREGDPFACPACNCLPPHLDGIAAHRGHPVEEPRGRGRPRAALNVRDRRKLTRTAVGRAEVAMRDAEAAGDKERAGRLQTALYGHRDGLLGDEDLDRLAGTMPAPAQ
jgi:hypothetical protein